MSGESEESPKGLLYRVSQTIFLLAVHVFPEKRNDYKEEMQRDFIEEYQARQELGNLAPWLIHNVAGTFRIACQERIIDQDYTLSSRSLRIAVVLALLASTLLTPKGLVGTLREHLILAYYYTSWDPSNFSRTPYQPQQDYNSDDLTTIQQHVREAQWSGIDGFVVSWYGQGDRTDRNFGKVLDIAQQNGFSATVYFETPHFWGTEDVVAQLKALYESYITHPGVVRYRSRPVLFFGGARLYDNATWKNIRAQVDPNHSTVWIADGDQFGVLRSDAWDGVSPGAIAWSSNPAAQLPSWGAKVAALAPDKLYIPPVSPGCNDSAARSITCMRDRADGAYYQATWDGALASNARWAIIVSTFNEWMESTSIEPSKQYGDEYLRITRKNASVFAKPEPSANSDPQGTSASVVIARYASPVKTRAFA